MSYMSIEVSIFEPFSLHCHFGYSSADNSGEFYSLQSVWAVQTCTEADLHLTLVSSLIASIPGPAAHLTPCLSTAPSFSF